LDSSEPHGSSAQRGWGVGKPVSEVRFVPAGAGLMFVLFGLLLDLYAIHSG
jgi:hypothetical protein